MERNKKHEIARADAPDDYENSGWIAVYDGERAGIFSFGHCSCYGTWDYEACDAMSWEGTRDELIAMARDKKDPAMPERTIVEGEYDYTKIVKLYDGILAWAASEKEKT